jgi:hypothetical protein
MSIRQPGRALIGFALVGCLCPTAAHAHLVQTGFGTFYDERMSRRRESYEVLHFLATDLQNRSGGTKVL